MPSRIFYANQEYISGKHLFTTIPNGTNLTLTDLANTPSCNVMIMLNDKVGINTTNPTSALHVVGNVLASGNIGIGTTNPTSALHVVGNVLASGNIGIGTTNPTSALHVVGNVLASGTITASNISVIGDFVTLNTITSNSEQMVITNNGTGPALKVTQTGDNSVAEFYDNESGIALFVGNNGNVGIGTTDPQAKLHVNGDINITTGRLLNTNQPHCSVYNATTTSGTAYVFTSIYRNFGNYYNTTNGRFTCPISGVYNITFQIRRDTIGSGGYNHAFVYVNEVKIDGSSGLIGAGTGISFCIIAATINYFCNANDYITIRNLSNAGTVTAGQCSMSVYLLG